MKKEVNAIGDICPIPLVKAKEAIKELKKAGVTKTVMLTGDRKNVADAVASELGIKEVYSELLPAEVHPKLPLLLCLSLPMPRKSFFLLPVPLPYCWSQLLRRIQMS